MEYLRKLDVSRLNVTPDSKTEIVLDASSGGATLHVRFQKAAPDSGSGRGMHTHDYDQFFYVISGTLFMEIGGTEGDAGPGTFVIMPKGVPHRNTNRTKEPAIFLNLAAPLSAFGQA